MSKKRRQNYQPISWFLDLFRRRLFDMDPPYQRRSVWTPEYRESFIDTILLDYPAPAIFLFTRVDPETGVSEYELVDGKQRLTAIFDFVNGDFPVSQKSPMTKLRGKYFDSLDNETKVSFYQYDFSVEYLPTNDASVVNGIFDRLNRNTAKLTPQELRHAQFDGEFINEVELQSEWMVKTLGEKFPRIPPKSRRQMRDVEITATLLLFLEVGPKSHSTEGLDREFRDRDEVWERKEEITDEFQETIKFLKRMLKSDEGEFLEQSRFRNQVDFYSLFAALAEFLRANHSKEPSPGTVASQLGSFNQLLESQQDDVKDMIVTSYMDAVRSASNDTSSRRTRIGIIKHVLSGGALTAWNSSEGE